MRANTGTAWSGRRFFGVRAVASRPDDLRGGHSKSPGDRVRDKIAASKRKGIWVVGPVPLGYRVTDKKVVAVPEEAVAVRTIFTCYVELGSIGALIEDIDRRGVRTKTTRLVGGFRFGTGALAHLLKNRFYIGEVAYRGAMYAGGHQAIIERRLFEAVQARLAENAVGRRIKLRSSPAILTGRIFDDRGNRMSPSHTKHGVRCRALAVRHDVAFGGRHGRKPMTQGSGSTSAPECAECGGQMPKPSLRPSDQFTSPPAVAMPEIWRPICCSSAGRQGTRLKPKPSSIMAKRPPESCVEPTNRPLT